MTIIQLQKNFTHTIKLIATIFYYHTEIIVYIYTHIGIDTSVIINYNLMMKMLVL